MTWKETYLGFVIVYWAYFFTVVVATSINMLYQA
jgi:hypothetical protein